MRIDPDLEKRLARVLRANKQERADFLRLAIASAVRSEERALLVSKPPRLRSRSTQPLKRRKGAND